MRNFVTIQYFCRFCPPEAEINSGGNLGHKINTGFPIKSGMTNIFMEICLGEKCNNHCLMCTNPDRPWSGSAELSEKVYSFEAIQQKIAGLAGKISAHEPILFTGGEPTIQPFFFDILNFTRQTMPENEIRILTNGRRFFYSDFTARVLAFDNLNVAVSLCGPDAETHDKITQTEGSFKQAVGGLANLLKQRQGNQSIEARIVVSRLLYRHLAQTLSFIQQTFPQIDRVIVIFMETEGQAEKNFKQVGLSYAGFRPYWRKIKPYLNVFREIRFYHFSLCAVPPEFWPFVWRTLPESQITFAKKCDHCFCKKHCLGIHKDYLRTIGASEFEPIKKKVAIKETGNFHHPIAEVKME